MSNEQETTGTLKLGETHPSAHDAYRYIKSLGTKLFIYQESYCSCAISGNRAAEICAETLRRVMAGEPVSDRYVLGLAWSLKSMEEMGDEEDSGS